jgi:hypothetical protein
MAEWNSQCDRFRFQLPDGWLDRSAEELRRLSHQEGCRVWAAAAAGSGAEVTQVHVTIVPGALGAYVRWLIDQSWGKAGHVTRVGGPFLTVVGGIDGALVQYSFLDYGSADPTDTEALPRHMSLLLVVAELSGYLYRISLYAPDDDLSERGPEFQSMLDSWLWADLVGSEMTGDARA